MKIGNCRINHLENPLGFALGPVQSFSWRVEEARGRKQKEARLLVKSGERVIHDSLWAGLDSLAARAALPLEPRTAYTWTVSVRTEAGEEAESALNRFETGKMEEPWAGKWIGCDDGEKRHPEFFREIAPRGEVASARLYVCGLGLYEARWNGEKLGEEYLTPYCSNYDSWVQCQTFDLTEQLQGKGVLSVLLGNGWYKGRFGFDARGDTSYYGDSWKLMAEVRIRYADGGEEVLGTDESWQVRRSRITFSNIYDGEHVDATLPELPPEAPRLTEPPKGKLSDRRSLPVLVREILEPKEILTTPRGETVIDLGQNMTGSFRLPVHEPRGTAVRLQFGEILQEGCFYRDNLRTAKAEYRFVSDGEPQVLEPKFTFYGFRYVKIEGVSDVSGFRALVLHSRLDRRGRLSTGNGLVNQLIHNVEWGQKGNFLDVPTDCPQRDEHMGWTGDAQVFAPTACYQMDSYAFFAKHLFDLWTDQQLNGGEVPQVIPSFGHTTSSAAWGDAACVIPWVLYQFYGDPSILEAQFDSMAAWVDYMTRVDGTDHGWRRHFHFGDWLALDGPGGLEGVDGGTDKGYIADALYRESALLTAAAARVLGKTREAERYEALAQSILRELREEYFSPRGRCAIPTQTGLVLALDSGLAPDPERTGADLLEKLKETEGMLRTGFVGTPRLCPVLTAMGRSDLAFNLLLNEEYPGWLYEVKHGATTIWERWNSVLEDGSISGTGMNSLNHYAYGSVAAWLYGDVAGLRPAEPGFRRGELRPHLDHALGFCEAEYASAAGLWRVRWELLPDGRIDYRCQVPFGCTARLVLPFGGGEYELEAGEFRRTYRPDRPVKKQYTTDTPLEEMLCNPRVKAALKKLMPGITGVPAQLYPMSIRQITAYAGRESSEEELAALDRALSAL